MTRRLLSDRMSRMTMGRGLTHECEDVADRFAHLPMSEAAGTSAASLEESWLPDVRDLQVDRDRLAARAEIVHRQADSDEAVRS